MIRACSFYGAALFTAAILSVSAGCGSDARQAASDVPQPQPQEATPAPQAPPSQSSPQETWAALMEAAANQQWQGFFACLTPESRNATISTMLTVVYSGLMEAHETQPPEVFQEHEKALDEQLKDHGIDLTEFALGFLVEDPDLHIQQQLAPVENKAALLSDLIGWIQKLDPNADRSGRVLAEFALSDAGKGLSEVQIEQDAAYAKAALTGGGTTPVAFRRIDGKWYFALEELLARAKAAGHVQPITSAALSSDGRLVLTGSVDTRAIFWDAGSGQVLHIFQAHRESIQTVAFSPDGRYALTGSEDSTAILWSAANGEMVGVFEGHTQPVAGAAFSPDSQQAVTGAWDGNLIVWSTSTGAEVRRFEMEELVCDIAASADGRRLLAAADLFVVVWDAASGEEVSRHASDSVIKSADLNPDGRQALIGLADNAAVVLDIATGDVVRRFEGHSDELTSVAFSPDGRLALTGSMDSTAVVWDTTTGDEIHRLQGHRSAVSSVAFSGDGRRVLTGSWDNTAILWNAQTGEQILVFGTPE